MFMAPPLDGIPRDIAAVADYAVYARRRLDDNAWAYLDGAAGDELTRENLLKQATNISKVSLPLLLPGITVSVSPTDYSTFDTFKLAKFDGKTWKFFGENISTASR